MEKLEGTKTCNVEIHGASPLLMHNGDLADPTNYYTKKISEINSKHHSKRTEADEEKRSEYEFQGGLYFDDEVGLNIPDFVIEGCVREGATVNSNGKKVVAGLQCNGLINPLIYDGPNTRDGLYKDKRFVDRRRVRLDKKSTLIRTRCRIDNWQLSFELLIIEDVISIDDVERAVVSAGRLKGLCDYRPKFGRFVVDKFGWS